MCLQALGGRIRELDEFVEQRGGICGIRQADLIVVVCPTPRRTMTKGGLRVIGEVCKVSLGLVYGDDLGASGPAG
jgi:hypothetical protein